MKEIISRFHVTAENFILEKDAYLKCLNISSCKQTVNASPAEIFNAFYNDYYDGLTASSMTNDAWEEAHAKAEELYKLGQGLRRLQEASNEFLESDEYFEKVKEFYSDLTDKQIKKLQDE